MCEQLLEAGTEVNCRDKHGNTALHIACYQGHMATVATLIRWGGKMEKNMQEMTPSDVAREEGENEVVRILGEWFVEHPQ